MKKSNLFVVDCNRGRIVFNPDGVRDTLRKVEQRKKVKVYDTTYTKPGIKKNSNNK